MQRLEPGDRFPKMSAESVNNGPIRVPDDLEGSWGVVLLYRGDF